MTIQNQFPDSPTQASPMRKAGQFRGWFTTITDLLNAMSPTGKPYSTDWIAGPSKVDRVLALTADWQCTAFACSREGRDVDMQINLTYVGAPVSVPGNGNITNVIIGQVDEGFRPRYMGSLTTGHTGPLAAAAVHSGGEMALAAVAPGTTIAGGTAFTFQGMWRMASVDAA
ncbi:hypothetical protein [Paeniglutamicibacter gangotriensis]|uniref:Uncharacterized protein n=1 Tax=Paeniglutamicibacter gangotriensis Lz1y TaxID=1276920 RepID=M7MPQ5_9MICC|nr:hypothetical protein [Paeniglutamicibacter gangotriensis]EMQ98337.1 hypothetical protein ADIAG_02355 [Paeniglutamicibacter gangotriensis Lz1y]